MISTSADRDTIEEPVEMGNQGERRVNIRGSDIQSGEGERKLIEGTSAEMGDGKMRGVEQTVNR